MTTPIIFFLFDTVKNKNKKKPKSKSPKNNKHFALSFISSNDKSYIQHSWTNIKNYCIEEIQNIIKLAYDDIRNNYSIDLYGSFTTGLMIEASDIDIRIRINDCKKKISKNIFLYYIIH